MNSKQRKRIRNRLAEAQGWQCCYCGGPMSPDTATLEHVEPISSGGGDERDNLAVACFVCNELAGDLPASAKRGVLRSLARNRYPATAPSSIPAEGENEL